jgi:hypothetical protein
MHHGAGGMHPMAPLQRRPFQQRWGDPPPFGVGEIGRIRYDVRLFCSFIPASDML